MAVGPRRSDNRPRAKEYYSVGIIFRKPKWISRQKTLSAASNNYSSDDAPLGYINLSSERGFKGLSKIITLFDLYEFNLKELIKRFRERRALKRSREKGSNTLSLELIIREKFY
jgi:hypothetical protein